MKTQDDEALEYLRAVRQVCIGRRDYALADVRLRKAIGVDSKSPQNAADAAYSESELVQNAIRMAEQGAQVDDLLAFSTELEKRLKIFEETSVLIDQIIDWATDHDKAVRGTGERGTAIIDAMRELQARRRKGL